MDVGPAVMLLAAWAILITIDRWWDARAKAAGSKSRRSDSRKPRV
jgi:hypothetical protein